MGSGKSSQGQKSYNYYGTVAGAIGKGPIDALHALWVDQKAIWEGTLERGETDYVDLTGAIDAKWVPTGGYVRVYWGGESQAADVTLAALGHPAYAGTAYVVLHKFLFGKEKTSAPNIQVIATRKPVVPTTIVAADDNWLEDGNCNPVAVLAELALAPDGLGLEVGALDATSWSALASWCSDSVRRPLVGCAPLLDARSDARKLLADILALADAYLVWTAAGTLALRQARRGDTIAGARTLDARHLLDVPKFDTPGLPDWQTGLIVAFVDRDKRWKSATVRIDDPIAARVRGEDARAQVARTMITRRAQANAHGAEWLRRVGRPPVKVVLKVSAPDATWPDTGAPLLPGDGCILDIDPIPGGSATGFLARITARKDSPTGGVELTAEVDATAAATTYQPAWAVPAVPEASAAGIEAALVIPLPASAFPGLPAFAVLAARPADDTTGCRVLFDISGGGVFPELGKLLGFALRADLSSSISDSTTSVPLSLVGGASVRDAYLATALPDSDVQGRTDHLVAVIANVVDGKVVVTDGLPDMEILSLVSATPTSPGSYTYTVLRERMGTLAKAWTTAAQVWILPGSHLTAWRHPDTLTQVAADADGLIRLSAYSPWAETEDALSTYHVRWGDYDDGSQVVAPFFGQSDYEMVDTGSGYEDLTVPVFCPTFGARIYGAWSFSGEPMNDIPPDVLAGGSSRGQGPLSSGGAFVIIEEAIPALPGYFDIVAVAFKGGRRSAPTKCRITKRAAGGTPPTAPGIAPTSSTSSIPTSVTITVPSGTTVYVTFDGTIPTDTSVSLTATGSISVPTSARRSGRVSVLAAAKLSGVWSTVVSATYSLAFLGDAPIRRYEPNEY